MSAAGTPQDDDAQQPLFGQPVVDPQLLALRQALAQHAITSPTGGVPVASTIGGISSVVSPLLGMLAQKRIAEQQAQLQNSAVPELANIMHSQDPISAMAASHNPLVRQMVGQMMPGWMKNYQDTQGAVSKATQLGPIDARNKGLESAATEPYEAQRAVDIAKGTLPIDVQKATDIEKATLPMKILLQKLGQAPTYAGQAETARHNLATENIQSGGSSGTDDANAPWKMKWGP